MTTGLLEKLKDFNGDYKRWLKESIIRNYGLCISMREDDMTLTEGQIIEKLKERDVEQKRYLQENVNNYTAKIKEIQAKLDSDTTEDALKEYDEMRAKYILAVEKATKAIENFEPKRFEYSNLVIEMQNSNNEILQNMASMVEQQFKYSIEAVENKLKYAEWEKPHGTREDYPTYYREQLEKDLKANKSRLQDAEWDLESFRPLADEYIEFCKAVDALNL